MPKQVAAGCKGEQEDEGGGDEGFHGFGVGTGLKDRREDRERIFFGFAAAALC